MAALKSTLSSRVSKRIKHTIATIFLTRSYCQTYSGYPRTGFIFQQDGRCTGPSSTQHRRFSGAIGAYTRLNFSNTVVAEFPDLNPVDYSIWSVLQKKIYPSRITDANELETRLIDEWARFDQ